MFSFKQFDIAQDKCAMKVGTDGTLLGAWVKADDPKEILDIGTGTGLIAMMMAQRFANAQVKAIELDMDASHQAAENFQNTPWANRLFQEHISLQEFKHPPSFDLIVSNPPYFENNFLNSSLWSKQLWSYTKTFTLPRAAADDDALLVFEGIKMGAEIHIDGDLVGNTTNQFQTSRLPPPHRPKNSCIG